MGMMLRRHYEQVDVKPVEPKKVEPVEQKPVKKPRKTKG